MGLEAGGERGNSGGVVDTGPEDTMSTGITGEVIVHSNVLLHLSVEPSKLQMFLFYFFQLSIPTVFAKQWVYFLVFCRPFICSWPGLEFIEVSVRCQID